VKIKEYPVINASSRKEIGRAALPHSLMTALKGTAKPLEVSTENEDDCQRFSEQIGQKVELIHFDVEEEKIWVRLTPQKKT